MLEVCIEVKCDFLFDAPFGMDSMPPAPRLRPWPIRVTIPCAGKGEAPRKAKPILPHGEPERRRDRFVPPGENTKIVESNLISTTLVISKDRFSNQFCFKLSAYKLQINTQ